MASSRQLRLTLDEFTNHFGERCEALEDAIRTGELGAIVIETERGDRRFALANGDAPRGKPDAAQLAAAQYQAGQLRMLASQLVQTEHRDRRRLAEFLHDHLQQFLVAARLKLGIMRHRINEKSLSVLLGQVDDLLKTSINTSRALSIDLSPPLLYEAGLGTALQWLARQCQDKHKLEVVAELEPDAQVVGEDLKVALFRAVRELLLNVARHAGVSQAALRMRRLDDDTIEILVADEGTGFDPTRLDGTESHGLGLFSVREQLGVLGGTMRVESAPGQGTRVVLRAPSSKPGVSPEGQLPGPLQRPRITGGGSMVSEGLPGGRIRVLLVDDHRIVRQGLAEILAEEPDLEVVGEAADGKAALEQAHRLNPDVVVMDISMPIMGGIEATRLITAAMPQIRVIGLSAHEEENMARALLQAGGSAYLNKGGPSDDLLAIIRACCTRKGAKAETGSGRAQ